MPTPTTTISASQIINEFGPNNTTNNFPNRTKMGSYRISQSAGVYSNLPLDSGVPQSGSISFSQLRNKSLNIVVDISGSAESRVNMRSYYDNNLGITVIGGSKSKPADPSGKKILVSINKTIGSASGGGRENVALRTGTWGSGTNLNVTIGVNAKIYGFGGRGGDFTNYQTTQDVIVDYDEFGNPIYETQTANNFTANPGSTGGSAIGIDYPTIINNYGYIQCGYGGGGAGGYRSR